MIVTYDDLRLIINLGPGSWTMIECQDQQAADEKTGERFLVPVIIYMFGAGMGRAVGYPSAEARDQQFEALKAGLSGQQKSNIIQVGIRPTAAPRPLIR